MTGAAKTATGDRRTIIGAFADRENAEAALATLELAGLPRERVSLIARDDQVSLTSGAAAPVGERAAGALTGGLLGGLAGLMVGMSSVVLPGIGPIVGAGIILAALAGAGIGAAAGGLLGALADVGVPEAEARDYETYLREGRLLLTVHAATDEEAQAAHATLEEAGGIAVRAYGTGAAQVPMAAIGRPATDTAADPPVEAQPVANPPRLSTPPPVKDEIPSR
jgi:uncharacterized membrane protein